MYFDVEIQGLISRGIVNDLRKLFDEYIYKSSKIHSLADRSIMLPLGSSILSLNGLHPSYVTSCIQNYYQFGVLDEQQQHYFHLIHHFMKRKLFTQLR